MEIHVSLRENEGGRWVAEAHGEQAARGAGASRERALASLRRSLGRSLAVDGPLTLIVEVIPRLAGVAEAAEVMGWDKRRVVTYIDRGRFPEPLQSLASGRVWLRKDLERFSEAWHARQDERRRGRGSGRGSTL
jgi:hypothetical protein